MAAANMKEIPLWTLIPIRSKENHCKVTLIYIYIYICVFVCALVYVHVSECVCVRACVCVCVCEREREREKRKTIRKIEDMFCYKDKFIMQVSL